MADAFLASDDLWENKYKTVSFEIDLLLFASDYCIYGRLFEASNLKPVSKFSMLSPSPFIYYYNTFLVPKPRIPQPGETRVSIGHSCYMPPSSAKNHHNIQKAEETCKQGRLLCEPETPG